MPGWVSPLPLTPGSPTGAITVALPQQQRQEPTLRARTALSLPARHFHLHPSIPNTHAFHFVFSLRGQAARRKYRRPVNTPVCWSLIRLASVSGLNKPFPCVRLPRSLHLPPSHRPFSTAGRRTENGSWVLSPCSITGIWRGNLRGFHTRVGRTTAPCSVRVGSGFPVPPIRRQPTSEVDQKFRLDFARTTSHEKSLRHIDFRKSATLARVKPSDDGAPSPQHHDNHGPPPATIEPQGLHDLV